MDQGWGVVQEDNSKVLATNTCTISPKPQSSHQVPVKRFLLAN